MPPINEKIWPLVIAGFALLLVYRRLRRNFGRQPVHPIRMWMRVGLLALLGCALLPVALKAAPFFTAMVMGTLLGLWGARRTRYATEGSLWNDVKPTDGRLAVHRTSARKISRPMRSRPRLRSNEAAECFRLMTPNPYLAATNTAYVRMAIPTNNALLPQRATIPTMTIS